MALKLRNQWLSFSGMVALKVRTGGSVRAGISKWLLLKPSEAEQRDIMELLHRRRKKSSTIFCSQYAFEGWYDQLGGDDSPLAEAILDRIKHDAYGCKVWSVNYTMLWLENITGFETVTVQNKKTGEVLKITH